jgi:hypothetical protein
MGMNPVPILDHWSIFRLSDRPLLEWLALRNGHPLFFPRIFYYLDIQVAHGTGYLLTASSVIAQSLIVILIVRLLGRAGLDTPDHQLTALFFVLPIAFSAVNLSNYLVGFMFHWFLASLGFVLVAVSVARLSAQVSRRTEVLLVFVTIAASTVAALSLGTGILALPLAGVMSLLTRQRARIRWLFITGGAASLGIYRTAYGPSGLSFEDVQVVEAIKFVLIFIGAPLARAIDTGLRLEAVHRVIGDQTAFLLTASLVVGLGGVATMPWLLRRASVTRSSDAGAALFALLAIQSWAVATALATYVARRQFGTDRAMSDQYWIMGILFWLTIPPSILLATMGAAKRITGPPALALLLLALPLVASQTGFRDTARWVRDTQYVAATMLASNVHDRERLGLTFQQAHRYEDRWRDVDWVRERRAAFFSEGWLRSVGLSPAEGYRLVAPGRCVGRTLGVPARIDDDQHGGWRISGWAMDSFRRRPVTRVILANRSRSVVGLGWGGMLPAQPTAIPKRWRGQPVTWVGYAASSATGTISVYGELDGTDVCSIGEFSLPGARE